VQDKKGPLGGEGLEDEAEAPEHERGKGPKEVAKVQGSLPTAKAYEAQVEA
jgi:hypothetical protein